MSVISRLRNAATFQVTEGGIDAHIQRVSITDGDGVDLTAASAERAPETPVSVSTAAVVLVAALTTRRGVLFYNGGPNDVWVGFSSAVTASTGQRIYAGGSWQLMGLGLYRGAIYGICATSESATVRCQQW